MILGSFNGADIVALPSDLGIRAVSAPASIEWDEINIVSTSSNPFTGVFDVFDWMAGYWTAQLSFASMNRLSADYWSAFISELRGPANVFLCGNPKAALPKGSVARVGVPAGSLTPVTGVANAPLVNGAGQTGYVLNVKGLVPNAVGVWLPGDLIQTGYRAYKVLETPTVDVSGNAAVKIWPPLRQTATEAIADGQVIITTGAKTLYRLSKGSGNKYSVTATAANGMSALTVREAL